VQRRGVGADLALVDDGLLVLEQELDRVLDREDVARHARVAVVEQGRQRRALARAGRADHQHQAALGHDHVGEHGRDAERLQRRDVDADEAHHHGAGAALAQGAQAEAPDADQRHRDVELSAVVELRQLIGVDHLGQQLVGRLAGQQFGRDGTADAVDLDQHRCMGRQVKVRRLLLGHQAHQLFHHAHLPPHSGRAAASGCRISRAAGR